MFTDLRERERDREKERQKNIDWLLPICAQSRDCACKPFGVGDDARPVEPPAVGTVSFFTLTSVQDPAKRKAVLGQPDTLLILM